jgi:hypothetical protein
MQRPRPLSCAAAAVSCRFHKQVQPLDVRRPPRRPPRDPPPPPRDPPPPPQRQGFVRRVLYPGISCTPPVVEQGTARVRVKPLLRLCYGSGKALARLWQGSVKALLRLYYGSIQAPARVRAPRVPHCIENSPTRALARPLDV